ncbi:MAG: hypothetical protein LUI14_16350 [Lachnospiraceae bacterium]|nr:hypothetical protein [Lachnospiraceae bacterium]
MKVEKKVISNLTKCYSIAPLFYKGKEHFLVAAEKVDKCLLFDPEGNHEEVVWEEPGGVMTMVQVPGTDGQFLATHKFYSPNDSKEAKLVVVTPDGMGSWEVKTLANLPCVHRFDILERGGVRYLIACTIKSDYEYKDDWRFPGKVYAAVLPEDLSGFDDEHLLPMTVIKDDMLKNHGYYRDMEQGVPAAVISSDSGVYRFVPPEQPDGEWEIQQLVSDPASDALLLDFDGDGEKELAALSPFHGDTVRFYKKKNGAFALEYEYEEKCEFLHSIFGGTICGKPMFVTGHRKGQRDLMAFYYDAEKGNYAMEYIDRDCGSANVYHYVKDGKDMLVSTNREIDEVALYTIEAE